MKIAYLYLIAVALFCTSCARYNTTEPEGYAFTRNTIPLADINGFAEPLLLSNLQKSYGKAEGQPGPYYTYKVKGQKGQFLWLTVVPSELVSQTKGDIAVHHIILSDESGYDGSVIWPERAKSIPRQTLNAQVDAIYSARSKNTAGQGAAANP